MIRVDNVHKHFDKGLVRALNGICLEIPKGEVCAVIGPSGCGKSTLLHLIGALDRPTQGHIYINGKPLTTPDRQSVYRNLQVGFIFQFHHLLGHLTLAENVALPALAVSKMTQSQIRQKACRLLSEVGLEIGWISGPLRFRRRKTAGCCGQGHHEFTGNPAGG